MLKAKEISQLFEVQLNTLYNWKKSKPKLYAYLQNADYSSKIKDEINILLDFYSKSINKNFTIKQIQVLIDADFELNSIEEVNDFETIFIKVNYKIVNSNPTKVLDIYNKLKELNIIEKYILYKKIYKARQHKKSSITTYFKEFLEKEN